MLQRNPKQALAVFSHLDASSTTRGFFLNIISRKGTHFGLFEHFGPEWAAE